MLVFSKAPYQLALADALGCSAVAYTAQRKNYALFDFLLSCTTNVAWQAGQEGDPNPWDLRDSEPNAQKVPESPVADGSAEESLANCAEDKC